MRLFLQEPKQLVVWRSTGLAHYYICRCTKLALPIGQRSGTSLRLTARLCLGGRQLSHLEFSVRIVPHTASRQRVDTAGKHTEMGQIYPESLLSARDA